MEPQQKFNKNAEKVAFDLQHRKTINFNISKYDDAVAHGKLQYQDLEKARQRAAHLKYKVLNDLDKYLIQFEDNFQKRGGKVIWAQDVKEAQKEILKIIKDQNATRVVKSKSMTTEEINLNAVLEKNKIKVLETDLGEYIVQLAGEKPYHIVTPAMHKSKEDVAELFADKLGTSKDLTAEQMTNAVREELRKDFLEAEIGITGANFLIADTGSIAVTENEGNAIMSMSFPKTHIAVVGIEKLIPEMENLDIFWPLLASYGTGQHISVYNSILSGPKQSGELDGPENMFVVLIDNGRSDLLSYERQRIALSCIRCGACLNACPVYKNIGGHAYETTYSGPIGAVTNPIMLGMEYKHQSFASTLCGKCTEVCPVKIPLHELLKVNRNLAVISNADRSDKNQMYVWKKAMMSRKRMDMASAGTKNMLIKHFFKKKWGNKRVLPTIANKSFSQQWKEKNER
ncbi:MAG: iron-sulfur cluster-binding protein [Bacteroidetes bacterium]|nr:iron-sulfur cluster-binding protein [Bacteroidota bacterium]